MKDKILNILTMQDILDKYNIKYKNKLFCCPFHRDKTPSAKYYDKSFYCFGCNKTGDLIQFVEYYYNLSFKEAMQKINEDFDLKLDSNIRVNYNEINKIKKKREAKNFLIKNLEKTLRDMCDQKFRINKEIQNLKKIVTFNNWENKIEKVAYLQQKKELLELDIENKLEELNKIKKQLI